MSDLQTKLGGGLNLLQDSLQQGKQKLQTVQEASHFKKLIHENSERRAEMLLQLGEETYQKLRTGNLENPELGEFFLKIAELDHRIFQAQKALEQLNKKVNTGACSNCGSHITVNDKFCGFCGQRQEQPTSEIDSSEKKSVQPVKSKYRHMPCSAHAVAAVWFCKGADRCFVRIVERKIFQQRIIGSMTGPC